MNYSTWNGFRRLDFTFDGKAAIVIFPIKPNVNKSWLLKTEYFDAFPAVEIEMLKRGWHVAYVENNNRWCVGDADIDRKAAFAKYIIGEFGLFEKCVPVGMSCGGLIAVKFAAKYPHLISALYLDAPVMNYLSCPGGNFELMKEFTGFTGMTASDLLSYSEHPIDKMHILLENQLPIILVYGDADDRVPYCENGALLEKYYKENGGVIVTVGKAGCGHHPHSLPDNTPIIEFIEKYK
jgi:pimeloyl-ACP methyl ester carboxylesterase